jgi:type I restriction enzyme M protein
MKKLNMRDEARCGMVVPEGALFRGGASATVKQESVEQFNLHTVVNLPQGTFAPYSDVKAVLLQVVRPDARDVVLRVAFAGRPEEVQQG